MQSKHSTAPITEMISSLVSSKQSILSSETIVIDTLLAHTLYLLCFILYNIVLTMEVINENFIDNMLIPAARLNDKNVEKTV